MGSATLVGLAGGGSESYIACLFVSYMLMEVISFRQAACFLYDVVERRCVAIRKEPELPRSYK